MATITESIAKYAKNMEALQQKLRTDKMALAANPYPTINITNNNALDDEFQEYFKNNYNQLTELRDSYFKLIMDQNKELNFNNTELTALNKQYKELSDSITTNYRKGSNSRYVVDELDNYYHIYVVIGISQLLVMSIIALVINGNLSKYFGFMFMTIAMILLTLYVSYYVFFAGPEKSKFDRYENRFLRNPEARGGANAGIAVGSGNVNTNTVDPELQKLVDDFLRNAETCPA